MLIERITVPMGKRDRTGRLKPIDDTRTVLVLCDALWAVHPDGVDDELVEPLFKITHKPTGHALTSGVAWDYALELLLEIRRRAVDWNFTDPAAAKALSQEWRDIQIAARKNLDGVRSDEDMTHAAP